MRKLLLQYREVIKLSVLAIMLLSILSVQSMQAAWTAPTASPTTGTVVWPVTSSGESQQKNAELAVTGSLVAGDMIVTGLTRFGNNEAVPSGMVLGVAGKVGAERYCNEDASSCLDSASLGSGSVNLTGVYTYNTEQNYQNISVPAGESGCSCKVNEILTGCSGTQGSNRDVLAVFDSGTGVNGCLSDDGDTTGHEPPICTCLANR